jgi:hypothetical protein
VCVGRSANCEEDDEEEGLEVEEGGLVGGLANACCRFAERSLPSWGLILKLRRRCVCDPRWKPGEYLADRCSLLRCGSVGRSSVRAAWEIVIACAPR